MTNAIPPKAALKLHALWMRANGAAEAANAARQLAASMYEAYQQQMASCIEMLGLDPKDKHWIDFTTSVIHDGDPPSAIGSEHHAVETNGRSA